MTTRIEAISNFLNAKAQPDLAGMYYAGMECQVNVRRLGGERITESYKGREWQAYSDGVETWKPFRIPRNAATEPEYDVDTRISFNLDKYVEGIGMTGWDWVEKCSRWVAFDFDAIEGHSVKHLAKLTNAELLVVKTAAIELPYVTVRKSTSGKGLHLYVALDQVPTANHNEHAALARAVLAKMSVDAGFDFVAPVDICGGNMWVWHRKGENNKGEPNPDSLLCVSEGGILEDVPSNWRDHIKVIKGERSRILNPKLKNTEDEFDKLVGRATKVQLEQAHRDLLAWLQEKSGSYAWDTDNNMLVTHTYLLQEASQAFNYAGKFQTDSRGNNVSEQNCFCFPMKGGAWSVRRFSKGCAEHLSWEQDDSGWTRAFLNKEPDLQTAARALGALEDSKGAFQFSEASTAASAMRLLGINLIVDDKVANKEAALSKHKDGRIIMSIFDKDGRKGGLDGWLSEKDKYTKIFSVRSTAMEDTKGQLFDDTIRFLVEKTNGLTELGWFYYNEEMEVWISVALNTLNKFLKHKGLKQSEIDEALGASVARPWTSVVAPFKDEYPGERCWNKNGARLKYEPSVSDTFITPTWDRVLEHLGKDIDPSVRHNQWCIDNGITKGSDYLRAWIASLFQNPTQPLPYLFFYSSAQNTGKSTLGEALSLLMTRGSVKAATCLSPTSDFNGELDGAVLCVVEEVELAKSPKVYAKLKDWVTATELGIHPKGGTPYTCPNTTHWIHTANTHTACPVFPGDTRIVVLSVLPFAAGEEISREDLMHQLREEAPDFLGYIFSISLPKPNGRMAVPCIDTHQKSALTSANQSPVDVFLNHKCIAEAGYVIQAKVLLQCFHEWLADTEEASSWTSHMFYAALPPQHPKGLAPWGGGNYVVNLRLIEEHGFEMIDAKASRKVSPSPLYVDGGEIRVPKG